MIKVGSRVRVDMSMMSYGYHALVEALPDLLDNVTGTVIRINDVYPSSPPNCVVLFDTGREYRFDVRELIEIDQ